jgi:hypothetical protein
MSDAVRVKQLQESLLKQISQLYALLKQNITSIIALCLTVISILTRS